jgi:prolyl-tRNA synthetase
LNAAIDELVSSLKDRGLRVKVDDRDFVRSGAKFFEWERKGVPLRIEIGPRDVKQSACVFKYRAGPLSLQKQFVSLSEAASEAASGLEDLQSDLFSAASDRLRTGIRTENVSYGEMRDALANDEAGVYPGCGLFLVPWKCDAENEAKIKEECKATIRCYPLKENDEKLYAGQKCFYSGEDATHMALFGRAF